MILWKRAREIPRLPPERLVEATIAGLRYVLHSPRIRTPLWRTFSAAFAGTAIAALLPLIARDILHGDSRIFGLRSEEHTSELQSLMRSPSAVFCLKKKKTEQEHCSKLKLE